jgi:hypothetical protein
MSSPLNKPSVLNINDSLNAFPDHPGLGFNGVIHSQSILINASKEEVWHRLTDINNWPSWQPNIGAAHLLGELKAGTSFEWKAKGFQISSRLNEVIPLERISWTGKSLGLWAVHSWILSNDGDQTFLVVHESMEGFLARILKKSLQKMLTKDVDFWLKHLKSACENQVKIFQ